jgi:hypothetical protein
VSVEKNAKRSRVRRWLASKRLWCAVAMAVLVPLLAQPVGVNAQTALTDREAIQEVQARYFRFLDSKDWTDFRAQLTPDVHVDLTVDDQGVFDDADSLIAWFQQFGVTVHQGHMPEIDVTSPDTANAIWAIEDLNKTPDGSGGFVTYHGYGHYWVSYVKVDDQWLVSSLTVTRLRVDVQQ